MDAPIVQIVTPKRFRKLFWQYKVKAGDYVFSCHHDNISWRPVTKEQIGLIVAHVGLVIRAK